MNNRTLVKITADENCLHFHTVTRERKSPYRFLISKSSIEALCEDPHSVRMEYDIGSFAQMWRGRGEDTVHIRFFWLKSNGIQLTGWMQTIILPFSDLIRFSRGNMGAQWVTLSLEEPQRPKLVFHAADNLHEAVNNPTVRRKLSRFLRDNFQWYGSDEIHLYNDLTPYSFFFREMRNGRAGICGGVILHGQDNIETARYAIHT